MSDNEKIFDDGNNNKTTIQVRLSLGTEKARTMPKRYSINPNLIHTDLDNIKKAC